MLTKELLCFRTNKRKILPKFINTEEKENLEIAEDLLAVFSNSIGDSREKLEEETKNVLERFKGNTIVARGLEKLLYDRTEFDKEYKEEFLKLRKKVFNCSSQLLREGSDSSTHAFENKSNEDFESYKKQIVGTLKITIEDLTGKLYGDLPPFQKVLRFRKISSIKLLHRYNCALVQGLLLRCERLTVSLTNSDPAVLRQILKYLRFNKLLVKISQFREKEKSLFLEIDGPLSMFLNTQKYGFNLAKFFPAILLQSKWELNADVRIKKNKIHTLNLNQNCGIISHYKQFLAYIPEEIKLLSKKISEKMNDWGLNPSSDYIHLGGESICFPDFLLFHSSGKKIYLELFHNWHFNPLLNRLEQVEKINGAPLLIGIEKILLNDREVSEKINNSEYFSKFGFFFKGIPSVSKIITLLDIFLKFEEK